MILHRYIVATTGMLNVIPNVFLTIKALIFNLPPASPGVYQFTCISIIHLDICDKCKSLFLLILNEMIFKHVQCSLIIRNIVYPAYVFGQVFHLLDILKFFGNAFDSAFFKSHYVLPPVLITLVKYTFASIEAIS